MRIFISTGEVSGDMQGALLVEALHSQAQARNISLEITALGGRQMESAGAKLLGDTTAIGAMGLIESAPFFFPTRQMRKRAKIYLEENHPDVLILIDYQGANLDIAETLRKSFPNLLVVYYIAPQQWVWCPIPSHTTRLVKVTDRVLAIFPEEARFYRRNGAKVEWVGHPLLDKMQNPPTKAEARQSLGISTDVTVITLLPASRKQELKYLLPVIFTAAAEIQLQIKDVEFLIPLSLEAYRDTIELEIQKYGLNARLITNDILNAIASSDLAITKSGTANLEIALLNVPQVVMYRVNPITIWIARKIFKMSFPFMSPANLVPMKLIVPELLQEEATPERVVKESLELLLNPQRRDKLQKDYEEMRELLGTAGVANRAANSILDLVQTNP